MALVESSMMELGTLAPDFTLPDTVSGKELSLSELKSDTATVVMFICNHCPYVHHVNDRLVEVVDEYRDKGVSFIGISSNDVVNYPDDSPEKMAETAHRLGYSFPYLYDESQEVAKAYKAECTPDFFVFDGNLSCVYRGRFDDVRPKMGQATGNEFTAALEAVLSGETPSEMQFPSMGCNIKWK